MVTNIIILMSGNHFYNNILGHEKVTWKKLSIALPCLLE